MRALSKDEILEALEEETMSTIYPNANGIYNAEELAANTFVQPLQERKTLSNDTLNALRAESRRLGRPLTDAESAAIQKQVQ